MRPLIPTQLKRVVRRASLGLGRDGSYSGNGSGDIFIAFSTANPGVGGAKKTAPVMMMPNDDLDPIFLATVRATEEAIVNAMVAAETMTGVNDRTVIALPARRAARGTEEVQPAGAIAGEVLAGLVSPEGSRAALYRAIRIAQITLYRESCDARRFALRTEP